MRDSDNISQPKCQSLSIAHDALRKCSSYSNRAALAAYYYLASIYGKCVTTTTLYCSSTCVINSTVLVHGVSTIEVLK